MTVKTSNQMASTSETSVVMTLLGQYWSHLRSSGVGRLNGGGVAHPGADASERNAGSTRPALQRARGRRAGSVQTRALEVLAFLRKARVGYVACDSIGGMYGSILGATVVQSIGSLQVIAGVGLPSPSRSSPSATNTRAGM